MAFDKCPVCHQMTPSLTKHLETKTDRDHKDYVKSKENENMAAKKTTRRKSTARKTTARKSTAKKTTRKPVTTRRPAERTSRTVGDPQDHVIAKLKEALEAARKKKYRTVRSCIDSARRVAMAQPEYAKERDGRN